MGEFRVSLVVLVVAARFLSLRCPDPDRCAGFRLPACSHAHHANWPRGSDLRADWCPDGSNPLGNPDWLAEPVVVPPPGIDEWIRRAPALDVTSAIAPIAVGAVQLQERGRCCRCADRAYRCRVRLNGKASPRPI